VEIETNGRGRATDFAAGVARVERAREAFGAELRGVSEVGSRALRGTLTRSLVGAALVGGAVGFVLLVRSARRARPRRMQLPGVAEAPSTSRRVLSALGAAVARFALEQLTARVRAAAVAALSEGKTGEPHRAGEIDPDHAGVAAGHHHQPTV
jgi:hypothetical protein